MKATTKHQMTILELEDILRRHGIFDAFGITQLGVFGSFARGEAYRDINFY